MCSSDSRWEMESFPHQTFLSAALCRALLMLLITGVKDQKSMLSWSLQRALGTHATRRARR